MHKYFLPLILFATLHLTLCTSAVADGARQLSFVVSIAPQKFLIDRITGGHVPVEVMLPPGVSDETYEPTITRLRHLSSATAYFKLGHPAFVFERRTLSDAVRQVPGITTVDCLAGIKIDPQDPHVWLSLEIMNQIAGNIGQALVKLVPEKATVYRENLKRLQADIGMLRNSVHERLDQHDGDTFLVYHPAWGYFAREFNLRQLAVEHEGKEPSVLQLEHIAAEVKRLGIDTIFVDPETPQQSLQSFTELLHVKPVHVDPLAFDWLQNINTATDAIAKAAK